jgi:putative tryptophan/tyrosine transport system substrate-binding protein
MFDQLGRREFITLVGGSATWSLAAHAQPPERIRRITVFNILAAGDPELPPRIAAFEAALGEFGWRKGSNLGIEYVWGWDAADAGARAVVRRIVESRPDLVVTVATPTTLAMSAEAADIPIVFIQVSDPVGTGLVASLSRPGGTTTGFTNFEFSMGGKWLELLKEIVPTVERLAFLFNPATAPAAGRFYFEPIAAGSSALKIAVSEAPVSNSNDLQQVMQKLARVSRTGVIVGPDVFTSTHRDLIVSLALQYRLPAVYPFRYFATAGGLLSYGSDTTDLYRRSAAYVDRILKGVKPADLPVQQPTKFELVINLRTAKALGIEVPATLLALADEVIE